MGFNYCHSRGLYKVYTTPEEEVIALCEGVDRAHRVCRALSGDAAVTRPGALFHKEVEVEEFDYAYEHPYYKVFSRGNRKDAIAICRDRSWAEKICEALNPSEDDPELLFRIGT